MYGFKQKDPLSPYQFVLCMEDLSHKITSAVEKGQWHGIQVSRKGPFLSNLCFKDDLLLFRVVIDK